MITKIIAKGKRKGLFLTAVGSREIYLEDSALWSGTEGPKERWWVDSGVKVGPGDRGLERGPPARGAQWRPAQERGCSECPWEAACCLESLSVGVWLGVKRSGAGNVAGPQQWGSYLMHWGIWTSFQAFMNKSSMRLPSDPDHHCL